MTESENKRLSFRVAELKDNPDHWVITALEGDGDERGKTLRKPDGTYWEVTATHIFPPGGGLYRVDIGNQISDRKIIRLLESSYIQARANIDAEKKGKLVQQYSGRGKLHFGEDEAAEVTYQIDEFVPDDAPASLIRRGRVSHAVGDPSWHPIISLHPGPFVLVMTDHRERKLNVFFKDIAGSVVAWGDFF